MSGFSSRHSAAVSAHASHLAKQSSTPRAMASSPVKLSLSKKAAAKAAKAAAAAEIEAAAEPQQAGQLPGQQEAAKDASIAPTPTAVPAPVSVPAPAVVSSLQRQLSPDVLSQRPLAAAVPRSVTFDLEPQLLSAPGRSLFSRPLLAATRSAVCTLEPPLLSSSADLHPLSASFGTQPSDELAAADAIFQEKRAVLDDLNIRIEQSKKAADEAQDVVDKWVNNAERARNGPDVDPDYLTFCDAKVAKVRADAARANEFTATLFSSAMAAESELEAARAAVVEARKAAAARRSSYA